ncbi:hypothetical protein HK405_015930, partial [Cladochytrium tenue]
TTVRAPLLGKNAHDVKPMYREEIWEASEPPSFDDISSDPVANESISTMFVRLVDLVSDTMVVVRAGEQSAAFSERVREEDEIRRRLDDWKAALPAEYEVAVEEPAISEEIRADALRFARKAMLFFLHNGTRCLVLQRRSLLYMRFVCANQGDGGGGGGGTRTLGDAGIAHLRDVEAAYVQGALAALAVGRFIEKLLKADLDLRVGIQCRSGHIVHAGVTLVLAAELEELRERRGENAAAAAAAAAAGSESALAKAGVGVRELRSAQAAVTTLFERVAEFREEARLPKHLLQLLGRREWGALGLLERDVGHLQFLRSRRYAGMGDPDDPALPYAAKRWVARLRDGAGYLPAILRTLRAMHGEPLADAAKCYEVATAALAVDGGDGGDGGGDGSGGVSGVPSLVRAPVEEGGEERDDDGGNGLAWPAPF